MYAARTSPHESLLPVETPAPQRSPDEVLHEDGISVQASVRLGDHTEWLTVGVAGVEPDSSGRRLLCLRVEAIPFNRRFYVSLRDVLVLATEASAAEAAASPQEQIKDVMLVPGGREGHA